MCATPLANEVPISARCTVAEAIAGLYPKKRSMVVDDIPKAIPMEPSISCAINPVAETKSRRSTVFPNPY
jgi:hypothetical protein